MSEQEFGSTPPAESAPGPEAGWGAPPPGYTAPPPPAAAPGLSESAASALAYVTFIPAIIFLLVPPYNQSPKIKFHSIQMLALSVVAFVAMIIVFFLLFIPILGFLIYGATVLSFLVIWVMCIFKASQGGAFKLPFISDFAAKQSGYRG